MGARTNVVNTQPYSVTDLSDAQHMVTVIGVGSNSVTTIEDSENKITVIGIGIKGDKGEAGDAGGSGGDKNYEHIQAIPASTWNIIHNLGKYPSVNVIDSTGSLVDGDVLYLDINTVQVGFGAGFSGKAFLN